MHKGRVQHEGKTQGECKGTESKVQRQGTKGVNVQRQGEKAGCKDMVQR